MANSFYRPSRATPEEIAAHLAQVPTTFKLYKRLIDCAVVAFLLPGLLFCILVLILFNPLFNRGPIFYRQPRIGLMGQPFGMLKFRTMVGVGDSPQFETGDKARVSRLGAFMRRTRVDEVPQILNVLKGEMSVIGPRPEQEDFVRQFSAEIPGYDLRHLVKPGITGLAQLKLGYTDDVKGAAHKLRWDMIYISRMGGTMESYIVGRTFTFVMRRLGRTLTTRIPLGRNQR